MAERAHVTNTCNVRRHLPVCATPLINGDAEPLPVSRFQKLYEFISHITSSAYKWPLLTKGVFSHGESLSFNHHACSMRLAHQSQIDS
uniref:SFRICE_013233 n=1 Tax=Spodoptera frugiperda TaxID=7108 RepID=A0A2H1WYT9_SPOFR